MGREQQWMLLYTRNYPEMVENREDKTRIVWFGVSDTLQSLHEAMGMVLVLCRRDVTIQL